MPSFFLSSLLSGPSPRQSCRVSRAAVGHSHSRGKGTSPPAKDAAVSKPGGSSSASPLCSVCLSMGVELQECVAEWGDCMEERDRDWKHQGDYEGGGAGGSNLCVNSWLTVRMSACVSNCGRVCTQMLRTEPQNELPSTCQTGHWAPHTQGQLKISANALKTVLMLQAQPTKNMLGLEA